MCSFRLERAGIPPQAYSSISSLSRMRERTLEVIVRSKKNVNRHEYGRAEKFLTKLRREREALDRKERETLRDEVSMPYCCSYTHVVDLS